MRNSPWSWLGDAQITIDSLESKTNELSSLHDAECCIITSTKLTKLEELVLELQSKINDDQIKVEIGNIMLNLPHSGKKWKGTWNAKRFYSLAYTTVPKCSAKYLQMVIPMIIAAFFHDINISRFYNNEDLRFVANLTPCDKMLDECVVFLNREYIFYRISTYIQAGAMGHLSHD